MLTLEVTIQPVPSNVTVYRESFSESMGRVGVTSTALMDTEYICVFIVPFNVFYAV